jgi:hypothetical protein
VGLDNNVGFRIVNGEKSNFKSYIRTQKAKFVTSKNEGQQHYLSFELRKNSNMS